MRATHDPFSIFLARYLASVIELATALRVRIRSLIPNVAETVDEPGRVVGYSVGDGYAGLVCTIIPSKSGVKLGIVRGADLNDPHQILEGTGKRHRYVQFDEPSHLARVGIGELILAARASATAQPRS